MSRSGCLPPTKKHRWARFEGGCPGPNTLEDAFYWPVDFLTEMRLTEPNAFRRLTERFQSGFDLRTWYSGMDCPHMSIMALELGMQAIGLHGIGHVVRNTHACDIGFMQRKVLLNFPEARQADHIFGDILDRLEPHTRRALEEVERRTQEKYSELVAQGNEPKVAQSICGSKFIDDMAVVLDSATFDPDRQCTCYKHGRNCPVAPDDDDHREVLKVAIAGVTCTDVCSIGLQKQLLGASFVPWMVWAYERRHRREDLVIQECSPLFPLQIFKRFFEPLYEVSYKTLSPKQFGWPGTGARGWTIAVLRTTMSLPRSIDSISDFFMSCAMDGTCFFCAPAEDVAEEKEYLAVSRKMPRAFAKRARWEDLLSPGNLQRLHKYDEERARGLAELSKASNSVGNPKLKDPTLCNIVQDADHRCILNALMPRLLRKSLIFCLKEGTRRLLIGREHLMVQGVPLYGHFASEAGEAVCGCGLSPIDDRVLAGNGMAIPVVGRVIGFVLAFMVEAVSISRGLAPINDGGVNDSGIVEVSDSDTSMPDGRNIEPDKDAKDNAVVV